MQHHASGDLGCPVHIFGDNQQLVPWSAASAIEDASGSDVDAPRGDAPGRGREREAIVGIRHASECATVGHTGKVTAKDRWQWTGHLTFVRGWSGRSFGRSDREAPVNRRTRRCWRPFSEIHCFRYVASGLARAHRIGKVDDPQPLRKPGDRHIRSHDRLDKLVTFRLPRNNRTRPASMPSGPTHTARPVPVSSHLLLDPPAGQA